MQGTRGAPSGIEAGTAPAPLRILFFLHSLGYIRFFDAVIRLLLERGHTVHLLLERDNHEPNEIAWLEELEAHPGFTSSITRALAEDRWRGVATRLRRSSDYARFLGPEFDDTPHLVLRSRGRAPKAFLRLVALPPFRTERGRRLLLRTILLLERAVPSSPLLEAEIEGHAPDLLVLSPHLMPGARHSEYIKSARALGIRTCVAIASWDNLSSKQLLHELPDRVLVWNDVQRREAEEIHSVPADRIVVTGAQSFDLWFDWQPRSREEFCARVGLDPAHPYVLYLGGSLFPGTLTEADWVRDTWIPAVREREPLAGYGILVRPHPSRMGEWRAAAVERLERVSAWPLLGDEMPVDAAARADFFDSIHHSEAVVGLNTSAMIETAIVGRPVLTVLVDEFAESQAGTFHFDYLLTVAGGLPRLARTLPEHLDQLADTLAGGDAEAEERNRRFVEAFVRPHGLEREATPIVVEAIEASGGRGCRRRSSAGVAAAAAALGARPLHRRQAGQVEARQPGQEGVGGRVPESSLSAGPSSRSTVWAGQAADGGGLRVLLSMWSVNYDRLFEAGLRELLSRGHAVHVVFETDKDGRSGDTRLFEELRADHPGLTWANAPARRLRLRSALRRRLRLTLDLLRYSEPEFREATALRARARSRAPMLGAVLVAALGPVRPVRRLLAAALRRVESALPPDPAISELVAELEPDLVAVTPLVMLGSAQGEYLGAARALGVPTAFLVASWDNLTNKGVVHDRPDLTLVWNEAQRREATALHGLPPARVVATGAHSYDHWFEWEPSRSREELCAELGLDPSRPILLYACSSPFIAPAEIATVERWLARIRAAADPLLRDASVVIRPHPANPQPWTEHGIEERRADRRVAALPARSRPRPRPSATTTTRSSTPLP